MTQTIRVRGIIIRDGKLLMQFSRDGDAVWCALPGGGVEPGERIVDALGRELREELGVEAAIGPLRYVCDMPHAPRYAGPAAAGAGTWHMIQHFFEITMIDRDPVLGAGADNHATHVDWVPLEQVPTLPIYPGPLPPSFVFDAHASFPRGALYIAEA